MTDLFDAIIVGGEPVGVAMSIELGLNNVKTLICEKHETPLLSPFAQRTIYEAIYVLRAGWTNA